MKIHVYSLGWNEEAILPFFLRHYGQFASKIVFHDNMSDDRSVEILKANPLVELHHHDSGGWADEDFIRWTKNDSWCGDTEADWIIACDTDEIIYAPNMVECLRKCKVDGITVLHSAYYEMVSYESIPDDGYSQIYDLCNIGYLNDNPNPVGKFTVFDPRKIIRMNYDFGCHNVRPEGEVKIAYGLLKCLHYHHIGLEHTWDKYCKRVKRHPKRSTERGLAVHHSTQRPLTCEALKIYFDRYHQLGSPVVE
jgi:Glycosyl transferase family 2